MLHQLMYYSKSTVKGGDREMLAQLRDIVSSAQRNNSRAGITGFLIFDKVWFVQVLEGDRSKVNDTYGRIALDRRHSGLNIVNVCDIAQRSFPNWTMGSALRTPDVQEIYLRHGIGGHLEPARIKSAAIMDLALDLQAFEQAKRLAVPS